MIVTIRRVEIFEPDWEGNLELPAAERVRVHLRNPTVEKRKQYSRFDIGAEQDGAGQTRNTVRVVYNERALITEYVDGVDNLQTRDEQGHNHDIRTGEELLGEPGLSLLVDKIIARLTTMEAEGLENRKNFAEPSSSGSRERNVTHLPAASDGAG